VAFGAILLAAAGILLIGGPAASDRGGGAPAIAVDRQVIDYGDVRLDTVLDFSVTVTNTGTRALHFTEQPYIEIVEGC
jgi:hypothetical protein